jgi:hypothetical protein
MQRPLQLRPRLRKIGEGENGVCCGQAGPINIFGKNYTLTRNSLKAMERILAIANPETTTLPQALEWFRDGMDIADALHLATATAPCCSNLYSFDRDFVKSAKGKRACAVVTPT